MMLLAVGSTVPAFAQETTGNPTTTESESPDIEGETDPKDAAPESSHDSITQFGGKSSVGGQLKHDTAAKESVIPERGLQLLIKPYFDWKAGLQKDHGISFGLDYNALVQVATESLGEDLAAGGVLRFLGQWTAVNRGTRNSGTFVYKVENRHRLGTEVAPQDLGFEIGYAGLTSVGFSDRGWLLTNLYWYQMLFDGRVAVVAGVIDVTDYLDVYGFINPWTDFSNLAFLTNPTIPAPDQGLGAALRVSVTENLYVLGSFADRSGDPSDPWGSFESFFDEAEYFTHFEIGWASSYKERFTDNVHVTGWYAFEQEEAEVPSGWGLAFSFNRLIAEKWEPFLRAGYSDGGGALWEGVVSAGLGRRLRGDSDVLALGLSWGRPSEETFGSGLSDQYTAELYYQLQLTQNVALTPDVQVLIHPANNPDESVIGVFGARLRISF